MTAAEYNATYGNEPNKLIIVRKPKNITASASAFSDGYALCVQAGVGGTISLTNTAGDTVTTTLPDGGRIEGPFTAMTATTCTGVVGYF